MIAPFYAASRLTTPVCIAQFIRQVNEIVAKYPAFRRGENCWFVDNGHSTVIAAFRRDSDTQTSGFLVVCNFDTGGPQHITIELGPLLKRDGPFNCIELLSGDARIVPHPRVELALPACGVQVLRFPGEEK
jgi:hypothetical protein